MTNDALARVKAQLEQWTAASTAAVVDLYDNAGICALVREVEAGRRWLKAAEIREEADPLDDPGFSMHAAIHEEISALEAYKTIWKESAE